MLVNVLGFAAECSLSWYEGRFFNFFTPLLISQPRLMRRGCAMTGLIVGVVCVVFLIGAAVGAALVMWLRCGDEW